MSPVRSPNPFVYDKTHAADIASAPIPALLPEQYAQCGEDLIALACLEALRARGRLDNASNALCIEIGANHGFSGSNSYLLARMLGVRTVLVEANPELLSDLRKARPTDTLIHAAVVATDAAEVELTVSPHHELSSLSRSFVEGWHEGKIGVRTTVRVPAMRIGTLLEQNVPEGCEILLLSIDVEGLDLTLARDLDFSRWRPRLVLLEPSEHFAPGEGARMRTFMAEQGYVLFASTPVNLLFVDAALLFDGLGGTGGTGGESAHEAAARRTLAIESAGEARKRAVEAALETALQGAAEHDRLLGQAHAELAALRSELEARTSELEARTQELEAHKAEANRSWAQRVFRRGSA